MSKRDSDREQADIFNTIPSAGSPDPFSGLDLDDMCVPPPNQSEPPLANQSPAKQSADTPEEHPLFALNPLGNIDIQEISVGSPQSSEEDILSHIHAEPPAGVPPQMTIFPQEGAGQKKTATHPLVRKAARYAEITRIREKISHELADKKGNIVLLASPGDGTGQSLLASALAYNTAQSTSQSVLLLDCNMRQPEIHTFFGLQQKNGFTRMIKENLPWQSVVKATELPSLHIITAGTVDFDFSTYLQSHHLPKLFHSLSQAFDLIIIDSSPILTQNKNNVDTILLTALADYSLLIINNALNTKSELLETEALVAAGNGKLDGAIYNHRPSVTIYSQILNTLQHHWRF